MEKLFNIIADFFKPDSYPVGLKQLKCEKKAPQKTYDWDFSYSTRNNPSYKSIKSFYTEI